MTQVRRGTHVEPAFGRGAEKLPAVTLGPTISRSTASSMNSGRSERKLTARSGGAIGRKAEEIRGSQLPILS